MSLLLKEQLNTFKPFGNFDGIVLSLFPLQSSVINVRGKCFGSDSRLLLEQSSDVKYCGNSGNLTSLLSEQSNFRNFGGKLGSDVNLFPEQTSSNKFCGKGSMIVFSL